MEVIIAGYAGFCFGVERAIGIVEKAADEGGRVVTYGPIIHNPQVVESLEKCGISVIEYSDEIDADMRVAIRSHGVCKSEQVEIEKKAGEVIDATCPFVHKAQGVAESLSRVCSSLVIFGEKDHPEVRGIISYAEKECFVVADEGEAEVLPFRKSYGFLAQTTQNSEIFEKISAIIQHKCEELKIVNTICSATGQRQKASAALAERVEVMVVIGGKNSANTTRLYHLCREICSRTYHIETPDELSHAMFEGVSRVGLTAGASTPKNFVSKVREYILEVSR